MNVQRGDVVLVDIATVDKAKVLRKLGQMPDVLMKQVHDALEAALGLP
jgi:mRNA-degrading endonuclease toxin of MazEF toxin-antitoxin module